MRAQEIYRQGGSMDTRKFRTAAVIAASMAIVATAWPRDGAAQSAPSGNSPHAIIDSGELTRICTPSLKRAPDMKLSESSYITTIPMNFRFILRKNPPNVPDCGSPATCSCVSRRMQALTIMAMFWTGTLIADCNDDREVNAADIHYLVDHLYRNGPPPVPDREYTNAVKADFNSDRDLDLTDLVTTIYFFHGFAKPEVPVAPEWLREELRKDSLGIE